MVTTVQPGGFQFLQMLRTHQAEGATGFQLGFRLDPPNRFNEGVQFLAVGHGGPGGHHGKFVGAEGLGFFGGGHQLVDTQQFILRRIGGEFGGLCTKAAIFRAPTGFGVDDGADFYCASLEFVADFIRAFKQIFQFGVRQVSQLLRQVAADAFTRKALRHHGIDQFFSHDIHWNS